MTKTKKTHTPGYDKICRASGHEEELCALHAAAPELLELLKMAYRHLDGCSHGYPTGLWDSIERAIRQSGGGGE